MKLSVIGLGKLGSPLVACLADAGHEVVGVDVNRDFVSQLEDGVAPVSEPGLQELISANAERISATTDIWQAVTATEATFVIVPTPSDETGAFTNKHVIAACKDIGQAIVDKDTWHLVVIVSTVMPGSCDYEIQHAICSAVTGDENLFWRQEWDWDLLGLCYSPEFIALGSVIKDMRNPDMLLIGEKNVRSGDMLEEILLSMVKNNPPVKRMSLVDAEIAKISVNTYITMKITYANLMAEICQNVGGADARRILDAIGSDSRIGHKYLKPATPYGGPCFPRDTVAFAAFAEKYYVDALLPKAVDRINSRQVEVIGKMALRKQFKAPVQSGKDNRSIAVLGLSYKPDTPVTECSAGIAIANYLELQSPTDVVVYDPAVSHAEGLSSHVRTVAHLEDALSVSHVAVIATAWPEFAEIDPNEYGHCVFIDCWDQLPEAENVCKVGVS